MLLNELFTSPIESSDARYKIIQHIAQIFMDKDWKELSRIEEIFQDMPYHDDKRGRVKGIPFTTNGKEMYNILRTLGSQGDEKIAQRILQRIEDKPVDGNNELAYA